MAAESENFEKLLGQYRSNQLQYLTTQRPEYKKAADIAERAVQDALTKKQILVEDQRKAMTGFASEYASSHKELFTLADQANDMRGDTQKLVDKYETSKQRYDFWSEKPPTGSTIDYANGYGILWRVGIIMLIVPILILVGFYSPQLYELGVGVSSWFGSGYGSAYGPPMSPYASPYSTAPAMFSNPRAGRGWF
jgi:hypothetical protein